MPLKLALYSDQVEGVTDKVDGYLKRWLRPGAVIGHLPSSPDPDRRWFNERVRYYARLG